MPVHAGTVMMMTMTMISMTDAHVDDDDDEKEDDDVSTRESAEKRAGSSFSGRSLRRNFVQNKQYACNDSVMTVYITYAYIISYISLYIYIYLSASVQGQSLIATPPRHAEAVTLRLLKQCLYRCQYRQCRVANGPKLV